MTTRQTPSDTRTVEQGPPVYRSRQPQHTLHSTGRTQPPTVLPAGPTVSQGMCRDHNLHTDCCHTAGYDSRRCPSFMSIDGPTATSNTNTPGTVARCGAVAALGRAPHAGFTGDSYEAKQHGCGQQAHGPGCQQTLAHCCTTAQTAQSMICGPAQHQRKANNIGVTYITTNGWVVAAKTVASGSL